MEKAVKLLTELYHQWSGEKADQITSFPSSGSNRKYYRLSGKSKSAIGVIGSEDRENIAFLDFTRHFKKTGLMVPEIYNSDLNKGIYLQEDLGDQSLFDLVTGTNQPENISSDVKNLYKESLKCLIRFQVDGHKGFDYSWCYPAREFGRQGQQWDLNYFKYYYLKPSGILFNEQELENDFSRLIEFLSTVGTEFFMYRDFQSRNILVKENKPFFIDYQGGRKGPLQYDLASLLFQAKANLPPGFREEMLHYYLDKLSEKIPVDRSLFIDHYYGFILLRTLQVLGAYGYRGNFEQKTHFIESAKFALENVKWFLENIKLPVNLPELLGTLKKLSALDSGTKKQKGLTVEINSFSYLKYGIPKDTSGHG
ncbi:MAG: phosphotransferase, partial [Bacteroidales bacterium]|nr:phosphotransferase [Bacteroidales bacterium]